MPKRVSQLKCFYGETELEHVRFIRDGRYGLPVGTITATSDIGIAAQRDRQPASAWLRVEREVRYLDKADKHACDWRCTGARPGGECWCECRGRNHGRSYRCEAA